VRDASSKPSHYDHNPLFRSFFQANINRFGSHSYDRTRHLHDFFERLGCRFSAPLLAAAFLGRYPGRYRDFNSLPESSWNSKYFCHTMDQQLHSPGNYTLNRRCERGSQSSPSFLAAAHAPIAMSVSVWKPNKRAVGLPGCPMCEDQKLSRIQMANITMNRRDSLSPLAIKKQHPLHPKISSHPELSNLSGAAVPQC